MPCECTLKMDIRGRCSMKAGQSEKETQDFNNCPCKLWDLKWLLKNNRCEPPDWRSMFKGSIQRVHCRHSRGAGAGPSHQPRRVMIGRTCAFPKKNGNKKVLLVSSLYF
eukprot:PhM_4_TR16079/c7_g3_i1/m.94275